MTQTGAYINTQDWMLQLCGCGAEALLLGLLASYADEQGNVSLSRSYMVQRLHSNEQAVRRYLHNLLSKGLLTLVSGGAGRGDVCMYHIDKKGVENDTLIEDKRVSKKTPLFEQKGYQKRYPNTTIINNNINALKRNAHARAREFEKGSMNTDYNFAEFWELFKPSAEFQTKRMSCLNEWATKSDEQRALMLAILKTGKQHRDNPLYFIRYCDENYQQVVYTRDEIYKQTRTTEPEGYCILERTSPEGMALWCKTDDAKALGWNIRRAFGAY